MQIRIIRGLCLSIVLTGYLAGCTTTQKITNSARTPTEQLLISEAVMRSLAKPSDFSLPIPKGSVVKLDLFGMSGDKDLVKGIIAGWLGQQGYIAQEESATYRMNIVVDSLGTEYGNTFFGVPPITAALIPISLPKLSLYEADYQTGYSKFHLDIFEIPSGHFVGTAAFMANTHFNEHTVLFVFTFTRTDLASPPSVGNFTNLVR
ncbi:MAG: hypothetical protein K2Q13_12585 [Nitrosomonas sp.]|uniref:hypothetical protein n=1 Tax=Nitrosomonas sp. TaxID=42353 RepID=UPI0025EC9E6A|nr:hypothetical protein [Nitrosomonas sp.]MBY0475867.1 hypothetical protein [Nitrosomonas sp.]